MTVAAGLRDAAHRLSSAGISDARLEAEVLLAHALETDRTHLLAELRSGLAAASVVAFDALLFRRLRHEPLAYILGHREFYGVEIQCAPGALIPRPETEMLVDLVLAEIASRAGAVRIADVGTGTGAIAIATCMSAPAARIVAIESSRTASQLARRNIERYQLAERVQLRRGHLLDDAGVFDLIVANLPYISEADWRQLPPEIRDHEPREALVGGETGTEVTEQLLVGARGHLAPGGLLALEIGDTQGVRLRAAALQWLDGANVDVKQDLAGRDRVLVARRTAGE